MNIMATLQRWTRSLNEAVARSIVGRIFRLEGSGHVSIMASPNSQSRTDMFSTGAGNQENMLHYRASGGIDHFLYHGLYHCRQCKSGALHASLDPNFERLPSSRPQVGLVFVMILRTNSAITMMSTRLVSQVGSSHYVNYLH